MTRIPKSTISAVALVAALSFVSPAPTSAQHAAGGIIVEYNDLDVAVIADGWSVVQLLRSGVYNQQGDFVGYVHDAIVLPGGDAPFVIVNVAGFLNLGSKLVALPTAAFGLTPMGDLVLPNATKDNLAALPTFYYAR